MFETFVDFLKNWADLLTAIVALGGVCILVFKTIKPAYDVIVSLPADVNKLKDKTKTILDEVQTNGGKSLKDTVVKLKQEVTGLVQTVEKFKEISDIDHENIKNISKELSDVGDTVNFIVARQWAVLNTTDQAVFETDASGYCIRANRAYLDICGRPFDEIKGNGWRIAIHPSDREFVTKEWQNAVSEKRNFEASFKILSSTNKTYSVFCIAVPITITVHNEPIITGWLGRYESVDFDVNTKP